MKETPMSRPLVKDRESSIGQMTILFKIKK